MKPLIIIFSVLFFVGCRTRKESAQTPSIPVVVKETPKDTLTDVRPEPVKVENFRLALLLSLNAAHYLEKDTVGDYINKEMDPLHLSSLHFLEGTQLATDKQSKIDVEVIAASSDSVKLIRQLKSTSLKEYDLVIASIPANMNTAASVVAGEQGYNIMFPVATSSPALIANKKSWATLPHNKTQCRRMISFLNKTYPFSALTVIYRENIKKEADLATLFTDEIRITWNDSGVVKKNNYITDGWTILQKQLQKGKRNIIIIPTSDEAFLSSILGKINAVEGYDILLCGLPTWEYFESIDFSLLEKFNTHIFNSTYIEYDVAEVKSFRKKFIEEYNADPLITAFTGYDIYKWIAGNFSKHGVNIENYESTSNLEAHGNGFQFKKICDNCGWENQFISVLKFQDGGLKKENK